MRASILRRLMEIEDERLREVLLAIVEEMDQELATRKMLEAFREEMQEAWRQADARLGRVEQALAELTEAQQRTEERLTELAEVQKRTEERLNELAEAQKRAEERMDRLEQAISELVEAQRQTEKRLNVLAEAQRRTEERLNELAEAQKQTEKRVNELAEAQKRTEERLNELAEAQKRTEERLNELAEVQKQTEERLGELVEAQKRAEERISRLEKGQERLFRQVGGLARSVAYALENEAYRYLPAFLRERYGLEIQERMIRREVAGREVNLLARARRNGEEVVVVGEAVLRLDDFAKLAQVEESVRVVEEAMGLKAVPVVVCHFAKEALREAAEKQGILVIQSFEWQP